MSKLYSVLDEQAEQNQEESALDQSVTNVTQMVDVMSADLENSIDLTSIAIEHAGVAEVIGHSLRSLPVGSKEYFACLENNKSVIGILSKRMGVKPMPAMEDFKNEYAMKSSHQISLESVDSFWRRSWEAIKKFFKEFFKKVAIFLKRIVNANLDLVSYEQYTDKMVAKLKVGTPVLNDNTPISTKLAGMLADKGQETVDSDFVLRSGMQKVVNLVGVINNISNGGGSVLSKDRLRNFRVLLENLVKVYNKRLDGPGTELLDSHITDIKAAASDLLTSMFTTTVHDNKTLPESVYEKLYDDFSTSNLRTGNVTVLSLVPMTMNMNVLPRDLNMFLAHQDKKTFFVSSYKEENTYAVQQIKPISNVSNLAMFYADYKKKVQTANIAGCSKAVETAEEEISKILDLLSDRYIKLMDEAATEEDLSDTFVRNLLAAIRESDKGADNFIIEDTAPGFGDLRDCILNILGVAYSTPIGEAEISTIDGYVTRERETFKEAVAWIGNWCGFDPKKLIGMKHSQDSLNNYKKFQDLNNFLTHVFTKLQIIFRGIVSDVFGLYTEIRYELVRYIYESCRRYSY